MKRFNVSCNLFFEDNFVSFCYMIGCYSSCWLLLYVEAFLWSSFSSSSAVLVEDLEVYVFCVVVVAASWVAVTFPSFKIFVVNHFAIFFKNRVVLTCSFHFFFNLFNLPLV